MEEITFLTATVQRLDEEIERLNHSRAALLRRLNAIRPISKSLPPETLALIFHHAAQLSPPARSSPLRMGSVCSHWRQIAWSTPSLWTYIDPIPIRRNAQHSDAHLLRLYFSNARALPVSIQIKLDRLSSSPSQASEEILRAIFIENSHNIGTLICTSKSSLRQRWAMLAPKISHAHFPNLHKLEINLRGAPLSRYDQAMFIHAPRLRRVSFVGYHLPQETMGFWEQMTVLELSALPVSQCLETLVKCVRLQEFTCTSPRQSQLLVDVAMHERTPVYLDHLTKFEWVGALAEWDVFLYTYVRLPNLRHLVLGNSHPLSRPLSGDGGGTTTDPELWKSFFRHVKALDILECTVFHTAQEWLDIFEIFGSTLRTLKFTAFRDADETLRLLRALQLTYPIDTGPAEGGGGGDEEGEGEGTTSTVIAETVVVEDEEDPPPHRNYLPNLQSLHATLDLHPDRSKIVLDILCSRHIRPLVPTPPSSSSSSSSSSSPPNPRLDSDNTTMASTISNSSTSSSTSMASSLLPPFNIELKDPQNPNDYLTNSIPDYTYWSTHTRLQTAVIRCWPFGVEFGERERMIARVLKSEECGLLLEVWGQTERVGWL